MKRKLAELHASYVQTLKKRGIKLNYLQNHPNTPQWNIIKQNTANIKNNLILTAREKLDKQRTNKKETGRGSL